MGGAARGGDDGGAGVGVDGGEDLVEGCGEGGEGGGGVDGGDEFDAVLVFVRLKGWLVVLPREAGARRGKVVRY